MISPPPLITRRPKNDPNTFGQIQVQTLRKKICHVRWRFSAKVSEYTITEISFDWWDRASYIPKRCILINHVYYTLISFLIGRKRTVIFRNQRLWRHLAANCTIIMPRILKVMGNQVMYDRGAWFLRIIMSSSRVLSCLASVKKQTHDFHFFCFVQCIIKRLLDSVFVYSASSWFLLRRTWERPLRETRLLFHQACASSSSHMWCTWRQFHLQPRSQGLSPLPPPPVVGGKTVAAAGHVTTQNLDGKKIFWAGGVPECFDCCCDKLCGF